MHHFPPAAGEAEVWEVMCFFIFTLRSGLSSATVTPFTCSKAIQLLLAWTKLCARLFSYNTWERFSMQTSLYSWFVILFTHLQFCFAMHFKTTSYLWRWSCLPRYWLLHRSLKCQSWVPGYTRAQAADKLTCMCTRDLWDCILWIILMAIAEKEPPSSSKYFNIIFIPKTLLFAWKHFSPCTKEQGGGELWRTSAS